MLALEQIDVMMQTMPEPMLTKRVCLICWILVLGAAGCSAGGGGGRDGAGVPDSDQQAAGSDLAHEAEGGPDAALPSGAERFAGVWAKDKTGEELVISNDCGNYWRVDFDYAYSQLTPNSETTLLLTHCADAACTQTDSSTSTLTVEGDDAVEEQASDLAASADCTIRTMSSTTLTLQGDGRGLLRWRAALTYVGDGCGPIKAPQTQGDSCEAVAETGVSRLD